MKCRPKGEIFRIFKKNGWFEISKLIIVGFYELSQEFILFLFVLGLLCIDIFNKIKDLVGLRKRFLLSK